MQLNQLANELLNPNVLAKPPRASHKGSRRSATHSRYAYRRNQAVFNNSLGLLTVVAVGLGLVVAMQ